MARARRGQERGKGLNGQSKKGARKGGAAMQIKMFTRCVHTMVSRNQSILHQTLLITLSKKTTAKMEFANLQSF